MAKKVKTITIVEISTSKVSRKNSTIITSFGEVEFGEDCIAEVSEEMADQLVEKYPDIDYVEEESVSEKFSIKTEPIEISVKEEPEKEEEETEKTSKESEKEGTDEKVEEKTEGKDVTTPTEPTEADKIHNELIRKNFNQLKALAKDSNLPEEEWKDFDREGLINYMVKKANEEEGGGGENKGEGESEKSE